MRRKIREALRPKKKKKSPYGRKLKSLLNNFHAVPLGYLEMFDIATFPSKVWGGNKMPRRLKFPDEPWKSGKEGADSNDEC